MTEYCCPLLILNLQIPSFPKHRFPSRNHFPQRFPPSISFRDPSSKLQPFRIYRPTQATSAPMEVERSEGSTPNSASMKLLFVEMGVGYDQHGYCLLCPFPLCFCPFISFFVKGLFWWYGIFTLFACTKNRQNITAAAMRACRDAISSNSIPAFRRGMSFVGFSVCVGITVSINIYVRVVWCQIPISLLCWIWWWDLVGWGLRGVHCLLVYWLLVKLWCRILWQ